MTVMELMPLISHLPKSRQDEIVANFVDREKKRIERARLRPPPASPWPLVLSRAFSAVNLNLSEFTVRLFYQHHEAHILRRVTRKGGAQDISFPPLTMVVILDHRAGELMKPRMSAGAAIVARGDTFQKHIGRKEALRRALRVVAWKEAYAVEAYIYKQAIDALDVALAGV